jgi:flagellar motor switch protein FliN/FliY
MRSTVSRQTLAKALAEELATAMLARTGGLRAPQAAENWRETGWQGAIAVSGEARGSLPVWIEGSGAQSLIEAVQRAMTPAAAEGETAAEVPPMDPDTLMRELITQAALATQRRQPFRGVEFGEITIGASTVTGVPLTALAVDLDDDHVCRLATGAEVTIHVESDERLEAVLDVSLPLVARFGQTVMPMRVLAALGPGAMVDLDRSPDEWVELLVGGRVVAKGEVVIVAGNYGVRILEVVGAAKLRQQMESVR